MFPTLQSRIIKMFVAVVALSLVFSIAAAGPKAYVGNFKDSTVSVIDTATAAVVATVPVAAGPHGMTITPDGRWLYVSSDGASIVASLIRHPIVFSRQSRSENRRMV